MKIRSVFFIDLFAFGIIATLSLCVGLFVNQCRDAPLSFVYLSKADRLRELTDKIIQPNVVQFSSNPEDKRMPPRLSLIQFKEFVEQRRGIILDARPEIFYRLGHVPGAIPLPRDEFKKYYELHKNLIEAHKDRPIVIYCSGDSCEDSKLVATALKDLAYSKVSIFGGGWTEWKNQELSEEQ